MLTSCFLFMAGYGSSADAQDLPAAVNAADQAASPKKRIQTEVITVTKAAAFPSQINRKPGPFFLLLRSQTPHAQWNLSLTPVAVLPDPTKLEGILDLSSLQKRGRSAGLVDLPPGEYHLQSSPDKRVLCTIKIQ